MSQINVCASFHNVTKEKCSESAKAEIDAFEEAERELMRIEKDLQLAEAVNYLLQLCLHFPFAVIVTSLSLCESISYLRRRPIMKA